MAFRMLFELHAKRGIRKRLFCVMRFVWRATSEVSYITYPNPTDFSAESNNLYYFCPGFAMRKVEIQMVIFPPTTELNSAKT